jgi:hypothetical protein
MIVGVRFLPVLFFVALTGCGSSERAATPPKKTDVSRSCLPARARGFRTCESVKIPSNPTIERWTGSRWTVVTGPLKPSESSAMWGGVSRSPDGKTLLADWMYPCDSAAVVFVPVDTGEPRLVTGEKDWRRAPVAHALGWTRGGKARVRIYRSWRGHRITPTHPRTFLFDPRVPSLDAHPTASSGC